MQAKASGKMLFEQVCKQLNLLETDYFGLEYTDNRGSTYWLDRDKPMNQQVDMGLRSTDLDNMSSSLFLTTYGLLFLTI